MLRLAACLLAFTALGAVPPCAPCHATHAARHATTRHARALRPAASSEFARALPDKPLAESRDGFQLTYTPNGRGFAVHARRGAASAEGRIDWVLGAGDQGITPLVTTGGRWLEHRLSYYTAPARFDLTLGHRPGPSRSAADALGIPQSPSVIRTCLGCHAKLTAGPGIAIVEPGVTCDRCHPPTGNHFANPAKLSSRAQVELCSACHRLNAPGSANDPLNIRFQPLRLVKSRCFQSRDLGCVNCHPAHADAVRNNVAFYREKCRVCHTSTHALGLGDCVACHMPKSSPAPYLQFTDHYIRRR